MTIYLKSKLQQVHECEIIRNEVHDPAYIARAIRSLHRAIYNTLYKS